MSWLTIVQYPSLSNTKVLPLSKSYVSLLARDLEHDEEEEEEEDRSIDRLLHDLDMYA